MHKDISIDKNISKVVHNIICNKPVPTFYANAWENAFITTTVISPDEKTTAVKYFTETNELRSIKTKLNNRIDPDILLTQIHRAKMFFHPLILIEIQKFTELDLKCAYCIADPVTLHNHSIDLVKRLRNYSKEYGLTELLAKYYSLINYSSEVTLTKHTEVSRAQYSLLIMILASMPEYDSIIALNKATLLMTGIESRKPTKILTHILCCIIYNLLQGHATNAKQKQKGRCRELTAEIVNCISPKDDKQIPYSSINRRGAEVALTER